MEILTRARSLAALAALVFGGCAWLAGVEYVYADPTPIEQGDLDLSHGVLAVFPEYAIRRTRDEDGRRWQGEPLEFAATDIDTRPRDGGVTWRTSVQIALYESDTDAVAAFAAECGSLRKTLPVWQLRTSEGASTGHCLSAVRENTSDPGGFHLPLDSWDSDAVVRRERLVVSVSESRQRGEGREGQMNAVIADIARRLGRKR